MNKPLQTLETANNYASAQAGIMRVFVRDLTLPVNIGIHPHERIEPQTVIFSVDLAVQEKQPPVTISDVVCYETVCAKIRRLVEQGHIDLVETLAEKIAGLCLHNPRVIKVRVRVEKPDAITEAGSVGVEIERFQQNTSENNQLI